MEKLRILTPNMRRFILDYSCGPNIIMRGLMMWGETEGSIQIEAEFRGEGGWRKEP